jgi:hypothetical protein
MFVEKANSDAAGKSSKLDAFARRHPALFDLALVVFAVAITIGLLAKPTYTLVLYQGF